MNTEPKPQTFEEFAKWRVRDRRTRLAAAIGAALLAIAGGIYFFAFSAPRFSAEKESFVVPLSFGAARTGDSLEAQGFVRHAWAFDAVLALRGLRENIKPGDYTLSKSMDVWQIASILAGAPESVWVVIPEGYRKEQTAEVLAEKLGWTGAQKSEWLTRDTLRNWTLPGAPVDKNYAEGVYFPETYLIPLGEAPTTTARRMQTEFASKYADYSNEAYAQNIKWTTVVKLASIIQREAAGPGDMPLISGILWNRLLSGMPLDIDATVQYARDTEASGWWAPLKAGAIKSTNSPYNTYLHVGLPPGAICSPGIDAMKAVLYPQKTDCLYYLHDASRQIHCSATYAGQQANIQEYLK